MKTLTELLTVTVAAALTALTANATIILNTDYTTAGSPSYTNGPLVGQNGWLGQNNDRVTNSATFGEVAAFGGWICSCYGNGFRGGINGVANAVGGFNAGDVVNITYDYQFTVGNGNNVSLCAVGFVPQYVSPPTPTKGFQMQFSGCQASTGGSVKFWPSIVDSTGNNNLALIVNGLNFHIDYANSSGNGTNLISDPMRIYYQLFNTGNNVWRVSSLMVSNRTSGATFTYTGSTRTFYQSGTDGFFAQDLLLTGTLAGQRAASDGVTVEYLPAPLTATWNGNVSGNWDTTTANWKVNGVPGALYADGTPVVFDDTATGTTSVTNDSMVVPLAAVTVNNTSKNYTLSGAGTLSGTINLIKNGPGTLTVSSYNDYAGVTTVSAGNFTGVTGGGCVNSAFTIANGATNGIVVSSTDTQFGVKSINFSGGTTYLRINYGTNAPSTGAAPLNANNGSSPSVTVSGTCQISLAGGTGWTIGQTYPLVQCTGTAPSLANFALASLPAGVYGQLSLDTFSKLIVFTATAPPKSWNGKIAGFTTVWDIGTTANWKDVTGSGKVYNDGDAVTFDDTTSAAGPVTVDLSTTGVSPYSTKVNNTNKAYSITGSQGIANGQFLKLGSGTLTMANANNYYTGGTDIRKGTLKLGAANVLPFSPVTVQTGGTLDRNGQDQEVDILTMNQGTIIGVGTLTLGGDPTMNSTNTTTGGTVALSGSRIFHSDSGVTVIADTLTGSGSALTKANSTPVDGGTSQGELWLTGTNSYDGGTTVGYGANYLRLGSDYALGTGQLYLQNAAKLSSASAAAHMITNALLLNGGPTLGDANYPGVLTFSGPVSMSSALNLQIASGVVFAGDITANSYELGISLNGGITLSGTNEQGSTTIYWGAGPMRLGSDSALGSGLFTMHNEAKLTRPAKTN